MSIGPLLRHAAPWWARVALKLVLSSLPVGHAVWRRLGIFGHGHMDDPAMALEIFRMHHDLRARSGPLPANFAMLELGPGDGLLSGVIAKAFGAGKSYLVDVSDYAARDPDPFRRMAAALVRRGRPVVEPPAAGGFDDMLALYDIAYLTDGLASLRSLPDASIDFCWSHAVLEHVRRADFGPVMRELRRVLKPGGAASHLIDLQDHLGGALDNLRFAERFWESDRVARAGFYTNRLQMPDYLTACSEAGFAVEIVKVQRWERLPTPRRALQPRFARHDDDTLRVHSLHLVLTRQ